MDDLLRRTLGDHIDLRLSLTSDLWVAFTDANQLESSILNLAINARDAMPLGGRLEIETENVRIDESNLSQNANVDPGDYVVIGVSDTGSGMSPEVIAKAIERFFTTKPLGEGTGLGLSMVNGFVKQARGHLRIDSKVGSGTSVRLSIPRALQDAVDLEKPLVNAPRGQGETILVVEDDLTVRVVLADALTELGYNVLTASDARPAIAILQSNRQVDLLMSDVMMPHVDGHKLAEIARNLRPGLPVLFVTGYAETVGTLQDSLAEGMDLPSKLFTVDALGAKVRIMIYRSLG
jgi:CheY-like chemotaxis protein